MVKDENRVPPLLGVSNSDGLTAIPIYANPTSHGLILAVSSGTMPTKNTAALNENGDESLLATSNANGTSPVAIGANSVTHGLFEEGI